MKKSLAKTLIFVSTAKILFEAINKISETILGISQKYSHSAKGPRVR